MATAYVIWDRKERVTIPGVFGSTAEANAQLARIRKTAKDPSEARGAAKSYDVVAVTI